MITLHPPSELKRANIKMGNDDSHIDNSSITIAITMTAIRRYSARTYLVLEFAFAPAVLA